MNANGNHTGVWTKIDIDHYRAIRQYRRLSATLPVLWPHTSGVSPVSYAITTFLTLTAHYSSRNLPYPVHNTKLVNGYHRSNGWRGVEGDLAHAVISVRSIHRDLPLNVTPCDSIGVALRNQINHGCRVRDGLGVGDRYGSGVAEGQIVTEDELGAPDTGTCVSVPDFNR